MASCSLSNVRPHNPASLTPPPRLRPPLTLACAGEVVYIPGGWWHAVLNLETAVAVTQNYVGDANLPRVVAYMAAGSSAYFRQPLSYYR